MLENDVPEWHALHLVPTFGAIWGLIGGGVNRTRITSEYREIVSL